MRTHTLHVDHENSQVHRCKCNKCDNACKDVEKTDIHIGECCYDKATCVWCPL